MFNIKKYSTTFGKLEVLSLYTNCNNVLIIGIIDCGLANGRFKHAIELHKYEYEFLNLTDRDIVMEILDKYHEVMDYSTIIKDN